MMMMALKKRPKKIPSSKFKGGGSIANNRNTVKLMFCHTHYDVENHDDEDDEEELYGKEANADAYYEYRNRDRRAYDEELDERMFRCPFDLAIIRKIARQEFGMEVAADASASSNSLEYYHAPTLQWKPLIDLEELQSFQRDNKPIPIRDPSHFDDEILFDKSDEEDETYDDEDMRNDSRNDQNARKKRQNTTLSREQIVDTIWCLAHALQEEGYIRVSNDEIQHQKTIHSSIISFGSRERCDDENSNAAISKTPHELLNNPASFKDMTTDKRIKTRDWVMLQANRNLVLYTWIVSQPGVLNHITQCLHFDMLWKKDNPSDTVSTRSG